jgi:hypothetical protein
MTLSKIKKINPAAQEKKERNKELISKFTEENFEMISLATEHFLSSNTNHQIS